MTSKKSEPKQLIKGKKFHKKLQKDWQKTTKSKSEKQIKKPSGQRGRIDIYVEDEENLVAVVEIKASDWDRMSEKNLRRNINRQIKQIWDYIESQLEQGKDVSPGIIFPERPKNPERMKYIEKLFEENGIPVVWEDETIEERKARS